MKNFELEVYLDGVCENERTQGAKTKHQEAGKLHKIHAVRIHNSLGGRCQGHNRHSEPFLGGSENVPASLLLSEPFPLFGPPTCGVEPLWDRIFSYAGCRVCLAYLTNKADFD